MKSKRFADILCLLMFKIVNEVLYMRLTSKLYPYSGLTYEPVLYKAVVSYVLFFVLCALPRKEKNISSYLLSIYLIFTMIPLLSLYWQSDRSTTYIIFCVIAYLILHIVCYLPNNKKATIFKIGNVFNRVSIRQILIWIIFQLLVLFVLVYGVADLRALNLYNVYEVRGERSFKGIIGYIINWLPYALTPCLFCISLNKRKWGGVFFAVFIQFYLFLFTGSKTTLFSVGLVMTSYMLVFYNRSIIRGWSLILSGISVFTAIIYTFFGELMPYAIIPVRLLSIPASISNNHYNFFSVNEKLKFAENFIGRILGIKSPYDIFSTYLVSTGSANANTGLWGDAYDNGGFICMVAYAIILAMILRYIDRIYYHFSEDKACVFVGILTYTMIYLNDGTLTAVMITGGLFINIFVLLQLLNGRKNLR